MPQVSLQKGSIGDFCGDLVIVPSDVDLTNKRANWTTLDILEKGGPNLVKELAAIGFCEIGNAVIVKGYNLNVEHVIFLPYTYQSKGESRLDFVLLHQALKNAFNLAVLYEAKSWAVDVSPLRVTTRRFLKKIISKVSGNKPPEALTVEEIVDVVKGVSREYDEILREVVIYR